MMLLVNPQSGKGQALTLYNNHIQRMLNEAGVIHTLVITGEFQGTGMCSVNRWEQPCIKDLESGHPKIAAFWCQPIDVHQ